MRNVDYVLSEFEFEELVKSLEDVGNYRDIMFNFASCLLYILANDGECYCTDNKTRRNLSKKILALKNDVIEEIDKR